jgi:hypothetical protein
VRSLAVFGAPMSRVDAVMHLVDAVTSRAGPVIDLVAARVNIASPVVPFVDEPMIRVTAPAPSGPTAPRRFSRTHDG